MQKSKQSARKRQRMYNVIRIIVLCFITFSLLFPVLIAIMPTFQTVQEASRGVFYWPSNWNFDNYREAWALSNFPRSFKNSLIISGGTATITIILGGLAAFPMGIRGNRKVFRISFFVFIIGMMLPFQSIMIPLHVMMSRWLGLTNTYVGPIAVYVSMTLPLTVFFYSQFIRSMSRELEEAAVVDGCGYLKMYWKIFFPLLKPVTSAILIQNMLFLWNDLLVPLILINRPQLQPIMPMVFQFFGTYSNRWNLAFSVLMMAAIPFLLVFLALQKHFIHGMSVGAVKG